MKILTLFLSTFITVQAEWTPAEKLIVQEILPTPEESAWAEIPWRINLWNARREANESGKPIYLWEMDGHPLGCV